MRQIVVLPSFDRCVRNRDPFDKKQLIQALEKFNEFLASGQLSAGLGFKKINHNKYEFRVTIRLRVVLIDLCQLTERFSKTTTDGDIRRTRSLNDAKINKEEGNVFYLVLVGDHDEVRRYLREDR